MRADLVRLRQLEARVCEACFEVGSASVTVLDASDEFGECGVRAIRGDSHPDPRHINVVPVTIYRAAVPDGWIHGVEFVPQFKVRRDLIKRTIREAVVSDMTSKDADENNPAR
jgi:hypothetical protein